jgi:glutamyl-tRNA synthetase
VDVFAGPQAFDVERDSGDFVVGKGTGDAAYQLAVVLDDAAMEMTEVVRGDDLLPSTSRQILLYRALGIESRVPAFCHVPMVTGEDGKRLSKRHGDTRLASYREAGVAPERIVALLARWLGIEGASEARPGDLLRSFDLEKVPRGPIVFHAAVLAE